MVLFIVDEFAMCLSFILYTSKACCSLLIRWGDIEVAVFGSLFKCQMIWLFYLRKVTSFYNMLVDQFVVHVLYLSFSLFKLVSGHYKMWNS